MMTFDRHSDEPGGDGRADLFKMLLHGFGILAYGATSADAACLGPDRPRQRYSSALIALIGNLTWLGFLLEPIDRNLSVLLANACFILEPQFNRLIRGDALQGVRQDFGEVFLNAAIRMRECLFEVLWPQR